MGHHRPRHGEVGRERSPTCCRRGSIYRDHAACPREPARRDGNHNRLIMSVMIKCKRPNLQALRSQESWTLVVVCSTGRATATALQCQLC
jgi:hypothetical protein